MTFPINLALISHHHSHVRVLNLRSYTVVAAHIRLRKLLERQICWNALSGDYELGRSIIIS